MFNRKVRIAYIILLLVFCNRIFAQQSEISFENRLQKYQISSLYELSIDELKLEVSENNNEALAILGMKLYEQEPLLAISYLEKAAPYDDALAILVWQYYTFDSAWQLNYPDYDKIILWSKALEKLDIIDFNGFEKLLLGLIYRYDDTDNYKDLKKSNHYFKKLYDFSLKHNLEKNLIRIYMTGYGAPQNLDEMWSNYFETREDYISSPKKLQNIMKSIFYEKLQDETEKKKYLLGGADSLDNFFKNLSSHYLYLRNSVN